MLKQFWIDLKLRKENLAVLLVTLAAGFVVGFGVLCAIVFVDGDVSGWFCLGTIVALFALLMCAVIFSAVTYRGELMLALSMGRTRRDFVWAYALRQLLNLIIGYVIVLALNRLELALGRWLFTGLECEMPLEFLTDWRYVLPVFPAVILLTLFIGTLYSRFGKKAGWIFYFLWLGLCFLGPRMLDADPEDTSFLGRIGMNLANLLQRVPVVTWAVVGIVAAAAMLVTIVQISRKQMVN